MGGGRGQLGGHTEPAQLDGRAVVSPGEQHAVRAHVAVHYVVLVTVAERLEDLAHVVAG